MAGSISENKFSGGINKDINALSQPKETLRDAVNIDLVDNGNFTDLTNIRGTDKLSSVVHNLENFDTANILGAFEVRVIGSYVDGTTYEHDSILVFSAGEVAVTSGSSGPGIPIGSQTIINKKKSFIYLYDIVDDRTTKLVDTFDDEVDALNFPLEGTIDAFYNKEKGENSVYFVDGVNDMKRIVLKLPFAQNARDMLLRPLAGGDVFDFLEQTLTGQLIAGTYQASYRYTNTETNKTSAWSALTNPIPAIAVDGAKSIGGLVGEQTNKGINFTLSKTVSNSKGFNAVQLAIIKNTEGTVDPPTVAYILDASTKYFDEPTNIIYKGTENETVTPIEDIVVEDAPIKTFKTINQKNNRLFGGNVVYYDLNDSDRGAPTFSDAYAISRPISTKPNPYRNADEMVKYRGYFHEELYRFGVAYKDKFGNHGPAIPLDFEPHSRLIATGSNLTVSSAIHTAGNADYTTINAVGLNVGEYALIEALDSNLASIGIFKVQVAIFAGSVQVRGDASAAVFVRTLKGDSHSHAANSPDFKFPARDVPEHSILDKNGKANALGLKIEGIKNHPSWAIGFSIVRMKRIKDIEFQTPHINMAAYQPVPTAYVSPWDAIPLDDQILGLKKFSMGSAKNITADDVSGIVGPVHHTQDADSAPAEQGVAQYMLGIQPEYVYSDTNEKAAISYNHSPSHKARIVDAVGYKRYNKFVSTGDGYSTINIIDATDRELHFYNREGYIKYDSDKRYFDKIEDQNWFPLVAAKETAVTDAIPVSLEHGEISLPETPFPGNWKLSNAKKYGGATSLSQQQGEHDSVLNSSTPGITANFGNPVENQRGMLLKISGEVEDYSLRLASHFVASSPAKDYTPLLPAGQKPVASIYTTTHLNAPTTNGSAAFLSNASNGTGKVNGGFYIMNIINGLGDDRYGQLESANEFIFTGHYQSLTKDDIDNNTEFTAEVFGGDCFIAYTSIKVNNSSLRPVLYDPNDDFTTPGLGAGNKEYKLGSYKDYVEILDFWCETEVDPGLQAQQGTYPNVDDNQLVTYNQDYLYPYNVDYSAQNESKIVSSRDPSSPVKVHYPSRIAYSDQKVYQSNIEGFDRFRTLSISDLEEQYGGITRLVKTFDSELYAVQDNAVRYIPVGKEIVELQDGAFQTLGSDLVIGTTLLYLSTTKGSQNMRTVVTQGDMVYGVDVKKREVWAFQSKGKLQAISDLGMYSYIKDNLSVQKQYIPERHLIGMYDYNKKEYWLIYNDWSDKRLDKTAPGSAINDVNQQIGGTGGVISPGMGTESGVTQEGSEQQIQGSSAGNTFQQQSSIDNEVISGGSTSEEANPPPVFTDIARTGFIAVFNERLKAWKTLIDIGDNIVFGGIFAKQELYTLSKGALVTDPSSQGVLVGGVANTPGTFDVHRWYTGINFGKLLGEYQNTTFDVVFNEQPNHSKIYDVIIINSSNHLDRLTLNTGDIDKVTAFQEAANIDINIAPRDGKYYINKIRDDISNGRLRGVLAIGRFEIVNSSSNDRQVKISSILNKFRFSERNF